MLSLTAEIKSKDGALSLSDVSRRYASADSSPAKHKKQLATSGPYEVPNKATRSNQFSPGRGLSSRADGKAQKIVESAEKGNSTQQQQWSTPLLATSATLRRMQSEEKILRRLSEPLGTVSATGTGMGAGMSLPASPSIAVKKTAISSSKDSSLRIVPDRERERERGRSSERRNRSGSIDKARGTERSVSPPKQQTDHNGESNHSFEQEREASYLNKHLGISSTEELLQDNIIGL